MMVPSPVYNDQAVCATCGTIVDIVLQVHDFHIIRQICNLYPCKQLN